MKLQTRLLLLVSAFAFAGSAFAQASSQSDFFAMQRMISDGYYATHPSAPMPMHQQKPRPQHAS